MLLQNSLYYHHYYKHMHFIPKKRWHNTSPLQT